MTDRQIPQAFAAARSEVKKRVIEIPVQVQHQIDDGEHVMLGPWPGVARGRTYLACVRDAREKARAVYEAAAHD